jgi:hypothetical protein
MPFGNLYSELFSDLKNSDFFENLDFFLKKVKNLFKYVWAQAREMKFCMNMLCLVKFKIAYSSLEFLGIRLKVSLKNLRTFFKNGQNLSKSVWVEIRELKFCMNMLCYVEYEITYPSPRSFFKHG